MTLRHYVFTLPLPPSVNGLWRSGRNGMYRSQRYEQWRAKAAKALFEQDVPSVAIVKQYHLELMLGHAVNSDIDNLLKATNDILQYCEVIQDDKQNWTLEITRNRQIRKGFCHASITELEIEKET